MPRNAARLVAGKAAKLHKALVLSLFCLTQPIAALSQEDEVTPAPPPSGAVVRVEDGAAVGPAFMPILTVNESRLYSNSAWGRRVQAELEQISHEVAAENDRLYDELAGEENALTELRQTLSPAEFRKRADAFDQRAQTMRAERLQVVRDLTERADTERRSFFDAAVPVFGQVMAERGAFVILDQRTVFVSADMIDVTDDLISRLDSEIGAGPAVSENKAPQPEEEPEG